MLWVVVGIVLVALSLRGPIIAPTPVIVDIRRDLGFSAAIAGLLTGLPVLLFAVFTPLATQVVRRAGPEIAILLCLVGVLCGTVMRSAGPAPMVLAGTVVIGAAITIGNIVVPVVIRRDVPWRRMSTVTGAYTAALNAGSMITSLGTAPLAGLIGWRWALVSWGVMAVVGVLYWWWLARLRTVTPGTALPSPRSAADAPGITGPTPTTPGSTVRVRRIGWWLTAAFCGQAFSYFTVTAWLPTLLADTRGLSLAASGASASLFQSAAIAGALGVPLLAARTPAWVPVAVIGSLWVALPLGLLAAPGWYIGWAVVGGIAQGGGFTTIFTIVARVVRTDTEAATTSARIQAGGYLAATVGPPLAGALYSATGGWTAPLLLVLVATLAFMACGLSAAREAHRRA